MNRLTKLFSEKQSEILNIYFTAGHPKLNSTVDVIQSLTDSGVDLIELGVPYSDPMADGETIQNSSSIALKNGMTLQILFDQVTESRRQSQVPIILMGYYNQMMQYGFERFLQSCQEAGVDGLIIPDLPMSIYERDYQELFNQYDLKIAFLITPETSDERILLADELSSAFIYVVSKSSITGSAGAIDQGQRDYFKRIDDLNLNTPRLIGFGIHDRDTYLTACANSHGAIIGSAFIRALGRSEHLKEGISNFVKEIR
jgi:tryptophan synthase alpha chain